MVLCLVGAPVSAAVPATGDSTTNDAVTLDPTSVTIEEIQNNQSGGTASPYAGENVTTSGTVTAVSSEGFHIQDGTGQYSGVYVYLGASPSVSVGDTVDVTGPVAEYNGLTEITPSGSSMVTVTGSASVPTATTLSTGEVGQEAYEGVLVRVENVEVTATPGQYGEWAVDDGSGEVAIDDVAPGDDTTPEETGATIDSITGPLFYSFGAFKVQPTSVENLQAPSGGDDGDSGTVTGETLTLLTYNDLQTAASNPTRMGRLEGAINQRQAALDNPTVVLGGGDQVSPSSLSPVSNWTVPIKTLNVMDPAAEVVGNHDLDFGFDAVTDFTAASEFPWLVANIQQTGTDGENIPGTEDYKIVERDGIRVGLVGLVDEAIKPKTAVDFDEEGYEVTDFVDTGSQVATQLKEEENVDVVVALAHIGVPESKELARNTDNIDAIVVGDDELEYPPQVTSGAVLVEGAGRGEFLGEVNLTVGDDAVAFDSGRLITVAENEAIPVNQTVYDIVNDSRGQYLSKVAGSTQVSLDSRFSSNYAEDTRWGNIIGDAFRAETGAEVAVTNAGGIRGNFVIDPGNVTFDDVYTSLPFGNTLVTKEMTGQQLKTLLASQVTRLDAEFGGQAQLQVSGVTYEYVDRPGADVAVSDLHVNGEPIDLDETYTVTVNSYMAGWDRISEMPTVSETLKLYGTATVEHVGDISPITSETANADRIRRVTRTVGADYPDSSGSTVTLSYELPETAGNVNESSVRLQNETSGMLAATDVTVSGDTLTATFDAAEYDDLEAASDTLELYGLYNDTALDSQRGSWSNSVLNGAVVTDYVSEDGTISAAEFQDAVDDWAAGELSTDKLRTLISIFVTS